MVNAQTQTPNVFLKKLLKSEEGKPRSYIDFNSIFQMLLQVKPSLFRLLLFELYFKQNSH